MAHVLIKRSSPSFVQLKDADAAFYGQHERMEEAINKRKYPLKLSREGYNIPHASQWNIMEYRVKKEIIGDFVKDMGCVVLNPEKNDVTLWKIIFYKYYNKKKKSRMQGFNVDATLGRGLLIIRLLFKWANKLGITAIINLKPIPHSDKKIERFVEGWSYNFAFGYFPDVDRGNGEEL